MLSHRRPSEATHPSRQPQRQFTKKIIGGSFTDSTSQTFSNMSLKNIVFSHLLLDAAKEQQWFQYLPLGHLRLVSPHGTLVTPTHAT